MEENLCFTSITPVPKNGYAKHNNAVCVRLSAAICFAALWKMVGRSFGRSVDAEKLNSGRGRL